jgi:tetratricopeptide (TPR) repeat protein
MPVRKSIGFIELIIVISVIVIIVRGLAYKKPHNQHDSSKHSSHYITTKTTQFQPPVNNTQIKAPTSSINNDIWNKRDMLRKGGDNLFIQGKYEEAIKCYDKALELDDKHTDGLTWNNKGMAFNNLGKYEEAIKCYDKMLEINPEDKYALNGKGYVLNQLEKYEEAIKYNDKALEIDPKFANPWNHKGFALYRLGKYEEGIKCIDKSLELNPKYAGSWNNKGLILYEQGKYKEAIKCYDKALEIDPSLKNTKKWKEECLKALGK